MNNIYWDNEEFEDLVARGLIAMYETKLKKHKFANKAFRFNEKMLENVRNLGCYFPISDRICSFDESPDGKAAAIQQIDVINDGRPDFAIVCNKIIKDDIREDIHDDMNIDCYLNIQYLERIKDLPKPIQCEHTGRKYR